MFFIRILGAAFLGVTAAGAIAVALAAFILPSHQTSGQVSVAQSVDEGLYICQPSGSTIDPECPVDSLGADEPIFAGSENLFPGERAWQKLRLTNVGPRAWDLYSVASTWTKVSDPGSDCGVTPTQIVFVQGSVGYPQDRAGNGPGITVLGKIATTFNNPVDGALYDGGLNDNHHNFSIEGTAQFERRENGGGFSTVHVAPGDYEDILLGVRLPTSTSNACLDVVWQLNMTWTVQLHPA